LLRQLPNQQQISSGHATAFVLGSDFHGRLKMVFGCTRLTLSIVATGLVFAGGTLCAQTAASNPPEFEVASIRQNLNPNPHWRMNFTADGVSAIDVTLQYAIEEAYGLYDDQRWSGGPVWLGERRFDIQAKFDVSRYPNPTPDQRKAMLQQLLADRFKLAVHHEGKEFPLYALTIAKTGPKLKESAPDEIQHSKLNGTPICLVARSRPGLLGLQGCTMGDLAQMLTGWTRRDLGRTIIDQTGLTGRYTLALQWTLATAQPSGTEADPGPDILTAVKEQLGLEMKPIKGPLDTIVIDHVEMPTEN
jgi:uncharacterized protein (TIGR03435 family)